MTRGPGTTASEVEILDELRQQAQRLAEEMAGPLHRISLRSGNAVIEIEWAGLPAAVAVPPPRPAGEPAIAAASNGARPDAVPVVSPIVGTFYRAPEPGAPPFVRVGDEVRAGQVIGIVEAMKLMNHIIAERSGRVAEVLVTDGEPVEFEQPLIMLGPVGSGPDGA